MEFGPDVAIQRPRGTGRAPALSHYRAYVRIVGDDPAALTIAEAAEAAVFTAARPRGLNRTNHDESRERRGPGVVGEVTMARDHPALHPTL
jgi:hypothetical protein